jgi:manganese oxidase
MRRLHKAWIVGVLVLALLAGCVNGGGGGSDYEPRTRHFDLYLYQLRTSDSAAPQGWELYPEARVDVWAFAPEPDRALASVPGPTIRARQGDSLVINFHNFAPMSHTIHWHGIHVPWQHDGVPYVSHHPIGEENWGGDGSTLITYEFTVDRPGTYWYHCHVDTAHHVDMGMYGALIVEPADPGHDRVKEPYAGKSLAPDREYTLMLDEWDRSHAHANEQAIQYALSRSGDPMTSANDLYGFIRDYLVMNDHYNDTFGGTPIKEERDWYPITYPPYFAEYDTFLINGKAMPLTEPLYVATGEVVRLRLVNAGHQVHSMHLHGHHFLVAHKDGYKLPSPYYADTILIGPGERYDLYVEGVNPGPWMFHDHIALNEANDHIHPGGMSTMLCYTDGWDMSAMCEHGHEMQRNGEHVTVEGILEGLVRRSGASL